MLHIYFVATDALSKLLDPVLHLFSAVIKEDLIYSL